MGAAWNLMIWEEPDTQRVGLQSVPVANDNALWAFDAQDENSRLGIFVFAHTSLPACEPANDGIAAAKSERPSRTTAEPGITGKEEDVEVGLQYFGKRYLNPLLGRWISADPLAVHAPGEADLNVYAYVSGEVLQNVDPIGLDGEDADPNGAVPYDVVRSAAYQRGQADGASNYWAKRNATLNLSEHQSFRGKGPAGDLKHASAVVAFKMTMKFGLRGGDFSDRRYSLGYTEGTERSKLNDRLMGLLDLVDMAQVAARRPRIRPNLSVTPTLRALAKFSEDAFAHALEMGNKYSRIVRLQSGADHGVDILAKDAKTGKWHAFEVKSTTQAAPTGKPDDRFKLSGAGEKGIHQNAGADLYTKDRLQRIGRDSMSGFSDADRKLANEIRSEIGEGTVEGTVIQVDYSSGDVSTRNWSAE